MEIHEWFEPLDWIVLFGYLGLTTWVGHVMRGKQASLSDFFAGGRSLPWLAVCGSIIATERLFPPSFTCYEIFRPSSSF